jgi:all-trans-retinol dehydrogenase (NAD+)
VIKQINFLNPSKAGGIGRHLVEKFLDLGCTVICIDYNQKELGKLKDYFSRQRLTRQDDNNNILSMKRLHFFTVDISSIDEIKSVSRKIKIDIGQVDILINNAGIMNKGKLITELSDQEIQNIFNVNVLAHFWLIREFLPSMIKNNKGHICNMASVCGLMGSYKLTDYCSTKFAVIGLTESIRSELKAVNSYNKVQTTVVCPFHVKTKLFNGVEFQRLNWAGLSMDSEVVAQEIVDGILLNKEFLVIPKAQTSLFYLIRK